MLANSPYSPESYSVGLLDLSPVLLPSPPLAQDLLNSALPSIDYLLVAARLGELYETIFPQHPEWLDEVVDWQSEAHIAKAIERFLTTVGKLFPINAECWVYEMEAITWCLYAIPIVPQGFDIWHAGWDELYEPSPYLLTMIWHRGEFDKRDNLDEFSRLYPEHLVPQSLEPQRLIDTLRTMALPEPLHALPDLIEMLIGGANNVWLDYGEIALMEGGGYPQWDPAEVAFLAEEWQKAEPICDRVHALLNWSNENAEAIRQKVTAVRQVLLEAQQIQELGFNPQLKMRFAEEKPDERHDAPTPATTAALAP